MIEQKASPEQRKSKAGSGHRGRITAVETELAVNFVNLVFKAAKPMKQHERGITLYQNQYLCLSGEYTA